MAPTDGNARLLAMYDQASRDLGARAGHRRRSRSRRRRRRVVRRRHVPMIIDGVGLMGDGDHTAKETAICATLPSQTKRAALLILRLMR